MVVPPGGKGMLFVDDARADAVFWMELAADGSPKSAQVRIPLGASVVDPEGLTTDGRYLYVGDSGDVIDTRTRKVVASLAAMRNSRKTLEIWWQNGRPVFIGGRTSMGLVAATGRKG